MLSNQICNLISNFSTGYGDTVNDPEFIGSIYSDLRIQKEDNEVVEFTHKGLTFYRYSSCSLIFQAYPHRCLPKRVVWILKLNRECYIAYLKIFFYRLPQIFDLGDKKWIEIDETKMLWDHRVLDFPFETITSHARVNYIKRYMNWFNMWLRLLMIMSLGLLPIFSSDRISDYLIFWFIDLQLILSKLSLRNSLKNTTKTTMNNLNLKLKT